jgi:hypothetical protein
MVYYVTNESLDTFSLRMQLIGIADPSFWTRFGVAYGLFLGALRSGATPNQLCENGYSHLRLPFLRLSTEPPPVFFCLLSRLSPGV